LIDQAVNFEEFSKFKKERETINYELSGSDDEKFTPTHPAKWPWERQSEEDVLNTEADPE